RGPVGGGRAVSGRGGVPGRPAVRRGPLDRRSRAAGPGVPGPGREGHGRRAGRQGAAGTRNVPRRDRPAGPGGCRGGEGGGGGAEGGGGGGRGPAPPPPPPPPRGRCSATRTT